MYVQVFHEAGGGFAVRTPENSCLAKSTALSMDSSVSNNNVSASMMMVGAKCFWRVEKECGVQLMVVPIGSPRRARVMLPGVCMSNTMMGFLLSMHRVKAVESITLSWRSRHS